MTVIYKERLASARGDAPELVLLHGWGSHSGIWRSLVAELRRDFTLCLIDLPGFGRSAGVDAPADLPALLDMLLPVLPDRAIYLGWSLGAMVATELAAAYPERVAALVRVAANGRFVADSSWPQGMAKEVFTGFQASLADAPDKTLRRFQLLQVKGDAQAKALLSVLQGADISIGHGADAGLHQGLAWLDAADNVAALQRVTCPVLNCFGANDVLVPVAAVEVLRRRFPGMSWVCYDGAAHLPFYSKKSEFVADLRDFVSRCGALAEGLEEVDRHFEKADVARSFSRAAASYDGAAELQRRVADKLMVMRTDAFQGGVPSSDVAGRWLDLGCGTGYSLPELRQASPHGQLLAVDLAEGMLRHAREHRADYADAWICADAEDLPLADASVDGVFSSLSLQWCENLHALYLELDRVLTPAGSVFIATLGPNTLRELRGAWQQVDGYVHVNQFAEAAQLRVAIDAAGLELVEWVESEEVLYYPDLRHLTRELKDLGVHNVNKGRAAGLTGRASLNALREAYEAFRAPEGLPTSYQVWCLHLRKKGG